MCISQNSEQSSKPKLYSDFASVRELSIIKYQNYYSINRELLTENGEFLTGGFGRGTVTPTQTCNKREDGDLNPHRETISV
jgi:hypothetical protein